MARMFSAAIALLFAAAVSADEEQTVVELAGLKSAAPADWKPVKPANRLRRYQFELPAAEGDEKPAVVVVMPNFGAGNEDKHKRWKGDFLPPEGKTIDEVAGTEEYKLGEKVEVSVLDITGTWVYKEAPFDPKSKQEILPGSRVVFVIIDAERDSFQIRLSGPEKTVTRHKEAFDNWLKNFKPGE